MSKADKMFEELGYKKTEDSVFAVIYEKDGYIIQFKFIFQTVEKYYFNVNLYAYCSKKITMQELQAINEKVKELGWNE